MSQTHIETYAKFKIHPGKMEEFKTRLQALVKQVRANEPRTMRYDWFVCDDKYEAVAMDCYVDEDAMFAHQKNAGPFHRAVLEVSDMSVEFLGIPTQGALDAVKKFGPQFFEFDSGLDQGPGALRFTPSSGTPSIEHIEIYTRFQIHDGKLEEFKRDADALLAVVKEKDTGTLRYDWFYDDSKNLCIAMDTYKDAEGMFTHMKNAHDAHEKLLHLSSMTTEFLGELPPAANAAVAKYSPYILPFYAGLKSYSGGGMT